MGLFDKDEDDLLNIDDLEEISTSVQSGLIGHISLDNIGKEFIEFQRKYSLLRTDSCRYAIADAGKSGNAKFIDLYIYDGAVYEEKLAVFHFYTYPGDGTIICREIETYLSLYDEDLGNDVCSDDFFIIRFCNLLYTKYFIKTYKIKYMSTDFVYKRMEISTRSERNLSKEKHKEWMTLSEGFCENFPVLLNMSDNLISEHFFLREISFKNEKAFKALCKNLLRMFQDKRSTRYYKIYFNSALVYINGHALWEDKRFMNGPKYFSDDLWNFFMDNKRKKFFNIDDYYVLANKDIKQILTLNMNENLYNKIIQSVYKGLNETFFKNPDNKGPKPLIRKLAKLIGFKFKCKAVPFSLLNCIDFNKSLNLNIHVLQNSSFGFPKKFGINVVKQNNKGIVNIDKQVKNGIFTDEEIQYFAFLINKESEYIDEHNYHVYLVDKNDIKKLYDSFANNPKMNRDHFNNQLIAKKICISDSYLKTVSKIDFDFTQDIKM